MNKKKNRIVVKNVGPIVEADFEVNKVNIFMGQQSSGKSTLAKIISYCTWVEKDVATNQSFDKYTEDKDYFKKELESYHRMGGYFNEESQIEFKSQVLRFKYTYKKFTINWIGTKRRYTYKRNKISYMPSDRNIVAFPYVKKLELPHINFRSFLFDWYDARAYYSQEKELAILNLGLHYYYSKGADKDYIVHKNNGKSYDILLSNASSGLQSITPLVVMMDYLIKIIYNQEEEYSQEGRERRIRVYEQLISELLIKPIEGKEIKDFSSEDYSKRFDKINMLIREKDPKVLKKVLTFQEVVNNLFKTHNTKLIIEEPEQNLFPETQRDLIYYLLEKIQDPERDHSLTLTTHSPYVLYALNNSIMAGLVYDKMDEDDKEKLICKNAKIDPEKVSIYQIKEGRIEKIQNNKGLIDQNYFDEQMEKIMDDYYLMANYYMQHYD